MLEIHMKRVTCFYVIIFLIGNVLLQPYVLQGGAMAMSAPKAGSVSVSKQIQKFQKSFIAWQKSLTSVQRLQFKDLFALYDELYKNYKAKPHGASEQSLVMDMSKHLQHVMDHWQSFYKQYIAMRMFDQTLKKWQGTATAIKLQSTKSQRQKYQQLFEKYEANPESSNNQKLLLQQQTIVQGLMA